MQKIFAWLLLYVLNKSQLTYPLNWNGLQLPNSHLGIFFNSNPDISETCRKESCPYKKYLNSKSCWGYEEGCSQKNAFSNYQCPGHHKGWVKTKKEQLQTFYDQADFGYVKQHRDQLQSYCEAKDETDSSLQCSDHMQFCKGKNIMIDFRDLPNRKEPVRYHMDVLKKGQITGKCRLDSKLLERNSDFISALQSWGPELRYFTETDHIISRNNDQCDLWIEKPAIITKIDASVSMYHHFCDFVNLYASQHVNNSDPYAFMTDTQVLIWETYPYRSNFELAWKAFTRNPIWNLEKVSGKRVCFKNVVFPLLSRMIFGLYYNTPIIWGCEKSGLFNAFAHHMLLRLGIDEHRVADDDSLHVTFLSRQTKHRRVLNENELIKALQEDDESFMVKKVYFTHAEPFAEQLQQDQWTDILIGMHGSGLTHLLFLPDWAVVFELYSCGDPNCYEDLARVRGVKYMTFENSSKVFPQDEGHHPELGAHEKFTNYSFEKAEFIRLVKKAAKMVRENEQWKKLHRKQNTKDEL